MKYLKKIFKISLILGLLSLIAIFGADKLVVNSTSDKLYSSTTEIPFNKVGLVLGTGKVLSNGRINLYYQYRIDAAVKLFKSGKVQFLLVSGDNSREEYDEPSTIKEDLIKAGVPENRIFLDYAGFRTLDSVVRCKAIFGQTSITVISQPFHNERAIYIANSKEIKAVAFNAKEVSTRYGYKVQLREKLARVKMLIDLLFGKKPKFLGDRIEIK